MQARQADHHRLPVRLPLTTHAKLVKYATDNHCSLNAAITALLDKALNEDMEFVPKGEAAALIQQIKELLEENNKLVK